MKVEKKFTKAQWIVDGRLVYALHQTGWRKGQPELSNRFWANVQGDHNITPSELEANAKLIASAPELLDALIELVEVKEWKDKHGKDEHYNNAMPIAWKNAKQAIEKATK